MAFGDIKFRCMTRSGKWLVTVEENENTCRIFKFNENPPASVVMDTLVKFCNDMAEQGGE